MHILLPVFLGIFCEVLEMFSWHTCWVFWRSGAVSETRGSERKWAAERMRSFREQMIISVRLFISKVLKSSIWYIVVKYMEYYSTISILHKHVNSKISKRKKYTSVWNKIITNVYILQDVEKVYFKRNQFLKEHVCYCATFPFPFCSGLVLKTVIWKNISIRKKNRAEQVCKTTMSTQDRSFCLGWTVSISGGYWVSTWMAESEMSS